MQHPSGLPANLVSRMQEAFFDLSFDGTLRYMDPAIGALHNPQKRIAVKLNAENVSLELTVGGALTESYEINGNIQKACRDAFAGYFSTFERLCRVESTDVAAA